MDFKSKSTSNTWRYLNLPYNLCWRCHKPLAWNPGLRFIGLASSLGWRGAESFMTWYHLTTPLFWPWAGGTVWVVFCRSAEYPRRVSSRFSRFHPTPRKNAKSPQGVNESMKVCKVSYGGLASHPGCIVIWHKTLTRVMRLLEMNALVNSSWLTVIEQN